MYLGIQTLKDYDVSYMILRDEQISSRNSESDEIKAKILANAPPAYETLSVKKEFEDVFKESLSQTWNGEKNLRDEEIAL